MIIVVSGSCGFIGGYLCKKLKEDHTVISLDIKDPENPIDVLQEKQVTDFFNRLKEEYGHVDVLINCIGLPDSSDRLNISEISHITTESFTNLININLTSVLILMREFIDIFQENKANIINISSMYSVVSPRIDLYDGFIKHPGYVASKAGLVGLTKYVAVLAAKFDIKVNSIAPGGVSETVGVCGNFLKMYNENVPLGRPVSLKDIYDVANMLVNNNNITGQNITIDGGYTLW
jgi:NAD(P)-dependent dehydrogenase (short-subunit alcohol dehydrogenase family)